MAKKSAAETGGKKSGKKVLEAARLHQDALMSSGLSQSTIDRFENALKGIDNSGKDLNAAAQTLVRDVTRAVGEFQGAIKKEFPTNASFHAFFRADEPIPTGARELLALAREVAKNAPDFSSNFIKYNINGASVKHLTFLSDQLDKELGGMDPEKDAKELEEHILEAARRAFHDKPELAAFGGK